MLILNPPQVKFGAAVWDDVASVTVDRVAARSVVEWSDMGPHAVFADVPEERVTIRVTRRLRRDTPFTLRTGESGELGVALGLSAGEAGRRRMRASCVVMGVEHETGSRGTSQTVTLVAVSATGGSDPVVVEDASDGSM